MDDGAVVSFQEIVRRQLRAVARAVGELEVETTGDHLPLELRARDGSAGDRDELAMAECRVAKLDGRTDLHALFEREFDARNHFGGWRGANRRSLRRHRQHAPQT